MELFRKLYHRFDADQCGKRELIAVSAVFVVLMLFCSGYTSPLCPFFYGGDSAIFRLIGKGMIHGMLPYVDLFDHKGPVLFFIEAVGALWDGRMIWLIQCLFGIITIFLIYALWKDLQGNTPFPMRNFLLPLVLGGSVFFFTMERGNLSEELSIPFIAVSLLLFVRYAVEVDERPCHPCLYAYIHGLCFSALCLIRINNAVSVVMGVLVVVVFLLVRGEFTNALLNVLFGFLGILTVAIPVSLYFYIYGALYDMLYATFLYNLVYSGNIGHVSVFSEPLTYIALYLPMLCSAVLLAVSMLRRGRERSKPALFEWILLALIVGNLLCLCVANAFPHYFTIYVPVFMLVLCACGGLLKNRYLAALCVICLAVNLYYDVFYLDWTVRANLLSDETTVQHETIYGNMSRIPEDERDSVIGYNVPSAVYLQGDILPCYRYYTLQDWWSNNDPSIKSDFVEWLCREKPLWVLTPPSEAGKLLDFIPEDYNLLFWDEYLFYYRLSD